MRAAAAKTATSATQPACRSPLEPRLVLAPPLLLLPLAGALIDARLQVCAFGSPDGQVRGRGPRLELLQSGAAQEEARVAAGAPPLGGGPGQPSVLTEVLSSVVDPRSQPPPRTQERLVGDLDRRLPGGGFPIEGEESVAPEGVHDAVDRLLFHVEGVQLAPRDAPPRVLASLSEGDQPQEHLLGRPLAAGSVAS